MTTVLIVTRSISFSEGVGGMERAAADHIRFVAADTNLKVILLTPLRSIEGIPAGVRTVYVPWPMKRISRGPLFSVSYLAWTLLVRRALRRIAFDVVHFHGASVGALPKRHGMRAICVPQGMEEFGHASPLRRLSRFPTRLQSRHARSCSVVVSTDASLTPLVIENLGVDPQRVVVIANAVDTVRIRSMVDPTIREQPPFSIVSVGRVTHNKGYDLLLEALRDPRVRNALPAGWVWTHFGSGAGAKDLIASSKRSPCVHLELRSGADDDEVQTAVAHADVFVQPSRYEGSSLTVLEAMTHGTLVVATPVGGIPDKVSQRTGILCSSASSESLATALARAIPLASGTELQRAAMGLIDSEFSWLTASEKYQGLYADLLGEAAL